MKAYLISAAVALTSVVLALGFFFAGYFTRGAVDQGRAAPGPAASSQSSPPPAQAAPVPTAAPQVSAPFVGPIRVDGRPSRGPENALVTVVEFSDFQCPFCKSFFDQTMPLVLSTYGDRVRWVYRDFPIANLHPQAPKAAEGGQCAYEQDRFWEYHDRLFQNQGALEVSQLKGHAAAVGLDVNTFNACLESGKYAQQVQQDMDEGRAAGVTGTPTFFVNGRKLVGAQPYPVLQKVLEEELAKGG